MSEIVHEIFFPSQKARLKLCTVLWQPLLVNFCFTFRNRRVLPIVSGLNYLPHKLATLSNVFCIKCRKYFGYSNSYKFCKSLRLDSLVVGYLRHRVLIAVDNLYIHSQ